ncbi:MAG: hypothetical protein ACRDRM_11965 [Pseudonocardiaceae bacterium]
MPVSPTPRLADPVLPHPVRRSTPPVVPPPEHRNLRGAAAAVTQPQTVVSMLTCRETAADSPGMPGPARLLAAPPAPPPGGRRSHRRRPPARRPLVFGAAVAGAAMFVGSMASSALPDTPGHATSSPTLDVPGHPSSAVGASGAVMLGAAARDAASTPISVVQAGLLQPSINPPPLGDRARPLPSGPVIIATPHRVEPETSSRSTMSTPPTVAPGDAPAPDAPAPPAGPEESVEQPQAGAPDDRGPDDPAPDDPAPDDPAPEESAPEQDAAEQGVPEEGAPEQGTAQNNGRTYSNVPEDRVGDTPDAAADQGDPQNGSGDEGGRHRR